MVRVWPAIVREPVRVPPGLASKLKSTLVLPVPLGVVTWSQESLAVANQWALAGHTESIMELVSAAGPATSAVKAVGFAKIRGSSSIALLMVSAT